MMSCKTKLATDEQYAQRDCLSEPLQMDRSVAYEMINDFGVTAYLNVVTQYQENMAPKLKLLNENTGQPGNIEKFWTLQYIRNCSAQLGLSTVSILCKQAMDGLLEDSEPGTGHSADEYRQFEMIIDKSIGSLRALCSKMQ